MCLFGTWKYLASLVMGYIDSGSRLQGGQAAKQASLWCSRYTIHEHLHVRL